MSLIINDAEPASHNTHNGRIELINVDYPLKNFGVILTKLCMRECALIDLRLCCVPKHVDTAAGKSNDHGARRRRHRHIFFVALVNAFEYKRQANDDCCIWLCRCFIVYAPIRRIVDVRRVHRLLQRSDHRETGIFSRLDEHSAHSLSNENIFD